MLSKFLKTHSETEPAARLPSPFRNALSGKAGPGAYKHEPVCGTSDVYVAVPVQRCWIESRLG